MEPRRLILFFVISVAIMASWTFFVIPLLTPPQAPPKPAQVAEKDEAQPDAEKPADGENPDDGDAADAAANVTPADEVDPPAARAELKPHPQRSVVLGSLDPDTGYFAAVETTTTGAAVNHFTLNDPRYKELDEPPPGQQRDPLQVVQAVRADGRTIRSLETSVPQIDKALEDYHTRLRDVEWEVAETVKDPRHAGVISSVTYRYVSPDGKLEIRKTYALEPVKEADAPANKLDDTHARKIRDTHPEGYQLRFSVTLINRDDQPQAARYVLRGPVGVPLENEEHTSIYRSVQDGRLDSEQVGVPPAQRDVELISVTAADVVEKAEEDELDKWRAPLKFIGVDVQYFAALLIPQEDQLKDPYIEVAQPVLIDRAEKENHSNISVELTSNAIELAPAGQPGSELTHTYTLFAGPKRDSLLEPLSASSIIQYGWFGVVSRLMLGLMNFMHDVLFLPYGFAIIFLTIIVRGCMYPISRKQAAGAKKMKELQPKIAELKKKYANDKEKFARAQMEMFSKHNYNPLAGCLPVLLQLPIFIGLYQALQNAVDLRLTPFPFTWIENLAAPDALFQLPFTIPFGLGNDFNLLPLLTVVLFVVQQKLFMPPPADEQQALQQKMMNFMMIFMGFMFYHVPAGLCVYFIASSLWGIGERKMLDYGKQPDDAEKKTDEPAAPAKTRDRSRSKTPDEPVRKGLLQRLMEAADAAGQASHRESASTRPDEDSRRGGTNGRGGGKRKRKSRR